MSQVLLFPDPRPLVEQLGADFFRTAPEQPGVYLMRDAAETVLYVGKAWNLRKRLVSYRVANPDRLRKRQLRLLRAVRRIELELCADESAALARESELLRALKPKFNRAGTWPGARRFVAWRVLETGLAMTVTEAVEPGWDFFGPLGAGAIHLRAVLLRLLWSALQPGRTLSSLPCGWFAGPPGKVLILPHHTCRAALQEAVAHLRGLSEGRIEGFAGWIEAQTAALVHPFEVAARGADLEVLRQMFTPRPSPP